MQWIGTALATVLAQNEGDAAVAALALLFTGVGLMFVAAVSVVFIAGTWKMFTKAGQPGWASLIPFYNLYVLLQIAGRPGWWLILLLVPLVNVVVAIMMWADIATAFGKGSGYALGLILLTPIFVLLLGFGDAEYRGPAAASTAAA